MFGRLDRHPLLSQSTDNGSGAGGPSPALGAPPPDLAALQKQLADASARIASYEKAEADRKAAADKAGEAERERMKKSGDLEKLLEAQNADIAGLKTKTAELEALAAVGKRYQESEKARLEAAKAKLTKEQVAVLDKYLGKGDLETASDMLAEMQANAQSGGPPRTSPIGPGGPPAPAGHDEIETMIASGMRPDDIRRKHPEKWGAFIHKQATLAPQPAAGVGAMFRKSA